MDFIGWRRVVMVAAGILLQYSGLSLLSPEIPFPVFIFASVAAIVLVRGFRGGLVVWLGLALGYDILQAGTVTLLSPAVVLLAYLVSFLSRRFVLEERGFGAWFAASIVAFFGFGYGVWQWYAFGVSLATPSLVSGTLLLFLLFPPVLWCVRSWEERLAWLSQHEFRGLRRSRV